MSQLGLGLNLSKTKGGVVPFNPLSLDPYLLFDTQSSMRGTLEATTLDLDPATPSSLDVITAVRAGVATYTDASGVIQSANADTVRVDQTQGAELTPTVYQRVAYTDFSLGWQSLNNLAVTSSGDFQGQPVFRLTTDGVSASSIYQDTIATEEGFTYTGSFYIRRISGSTQPYVRHGASASGNSTAIAVTTEWTRVSVPILSKSGGGAVYFGFIQSLAGNDVYEITQPQFEEGTTASSFVANTTGSPKFITGATYSARVPMILVEPSATNLVEYSEDFSNSYWGKNDVTVASAPVAAPDGTMTASHVVKTGANSHLVKVHIGAANTHIGSIWARTVSGSGTCFFDSASAATLSTVTDQWQRFEVTTNTPHMYAVDFRGASTLTEIYIWGAQLETGSVATSYIPTSGSTVTRAADDLAITGSAFSDFYNTSEGTIYVEHEPRVVSSSNALFTFSDGTTSNKILSLLHQDYSLYINTGSSVYYFSVNATPQDNTLNRLACSFKANKASASLNGSTGTPNTGVSMPTINQINLGARQDFSSKLNGHIKRVIYWPTHSDSL